MQVSIAICTYNREAFLEKCLDSIELYQQEIFFEVLVIDNGSNNKTWELCVDFCARNQHFKYFKENNVGLSHARNRAIAESRTPYVAFLDDDTVLGENYLDRLLYWTRIDAFEVIGGPGIPFSNVALPDWYVKMNSTVPEKRNESAVSYISGFNIVFKKEALVKVGGFNTFLGMNGKKIAYGEEVLPQVQIRQNGGRLFIDSEMSVFHYIMPDKLTLLWQLRSSYAHGRDYWITFDLPKPGIKDVIYLWYFAHKDLFTNILSGTHLKKFGLSYFSIFLLKMYCTYWGKILGALSRPDK